MYALWASTGGGGRLILPLVDIGGGGAGREGTISARKTTSYKDLQNREITSNRQAGQVRTKSHNFVRATRSTHFCLTNCWAQFVVQLRYLGKNCRLSHPTALEQITQHEAFQPHRKVHSKTFVTVVSGHKEQQLTHELSTSQATNQSNVDLLSPRVLYVSNSRDMS